MVNWHKLCIVVGWLAAMPVGAVTVYLAGDSTMAKGPARTPIMGWGEYLGKYVNVPVVNKAIGGRSARSYTNEGRFAEIENLIQKGDICIIEFGHNDVGSPEKNDNNRSDCPGTGSQTCKSSSNNMTVYTFNRYIEDAVKMFMAKGANVIVSSQTPLNPCESGSFKSGSAPRFVGYAEKAAEDTGASYVNHYQAVLDKYQTQSCSTVNGLFPLDHTHTGPAGAELVAQAFVLAVSHGNSKLKQFLKN